MKPKHSAALMALCDKYQGKVRYFNPEPTPARRWLLIAEELVRYNGQFYLITQNTETDEGVLTVYSYTTNFDDDYTIKREVVETILTDNTPIIYPWSHL